MTVCCLSSTTTVDDVFAVGLLGVDVTCFGTGGGEGSALLGKEPDDPPRNILLGILEVEESSHSSVFADECVGRTTAEGTTVVVVTTVDKDGEDVADLLLPGSRGTIRPNKLSSEGIWEVRGGGGGRCRWGRVSEEKSVADLSMSSFICFAIVTALFRTCVAVSFTCDKKDAPQIEIPVFRLSSETVSLPPRLTLPPPPPSSSAVIFSLPKDEEVDVDVVVDFSDPMTFANVDLNE
mmetsp:Transcript_18351/g.30159  ORF Transcript_18351/g.30159 Transcript_18351/m.30159 type:complete len:236 (+) Transcript_18351:655-1362(+)